ncbi:sugar phosphate isomerase/epimerase [uncultured Meiothermus sp.]|jgi:sugar phosphate isomerase/epimerase|uniref:sugar phosphate isomerase/epimerase family protein n=1 Tax=uncultured Meiothermus sp. TaxID=157471 RepID=UPI00261EC2AB|nr:sugar phosphate isomerase/epimerase [uncultured Meiothermus sp.]
MELGFVSAILPDLSLEQVLEFASEQGFETVEVMCWPKGKAERRYAGVTHIDVASLNEAEIKKIMTLTRKHGVSISGLGYYPNPLVADEREASVYIEHIKKVITASARLGAGRMNTFIGRDHTRSLKDNWTLFDERWPEIIKHAEKQKVKVGIENCPMYFTGDEWPGGKNMAINPVVWREMFSRIESDCFGLNYDPSHLVWQMMDPAWPLLEFKDKLFHIHAKDVRIDQDKLRQVGSMATPLEYHAPKLPGLGDVNWTQFFANLTEARYNGPVCIEVEDRAYEGSLEDRKRAVIQSGRFLRNFVI